MRKKTIKVPLPKGKLTLKKLIYFLVVLFCAWFFTEQQNQTNLPAEQGTIKVQSVIDGDTLKTPSGESLRLLGIDAPELAKMRNRIVVESGYHYAKEAKKRLEELALNQTLTTQAEQKIYDTYKRQLVELFDNNQHSINELLLYEGLVIFYPFSNLSTEQSSRFLKAQQAAITAERGLWKKVLSLKQSYQPVIANKRSKRFFPKNCAGGEKIAPQNRIAFKTAKEALMFGYYPARECEFLPKE
ncbi:thermonuclease family protein [Desulfovibrio litoralis]|uniref:Nuclease homologue n=1 Tax=Desulfovibrio litoralis DSM 11393 TaxID=1121455 RepID=A0A1M7SQP6_9BACT|nr:thermonuclease family protein [Desulfovibrio litoralis]SHN60698.1 nuclease homologue [Desulfovibrio litoralis DSM 11393]